MKITLISGLQTFSGQCQLIPRLMADCPEQLVVDLPGVKLLLQTQSNIPPDNRLGLAIRNTGFQGQKVGQCESAKVFFLAGSLHTCLAEVQLFDNCCQQTQYCPGCYTQRTEITPGFF